MTLLNESDTDIRNLLGGDKAQQIRVAFIDAIAASGVSETVINEVAKDLLLERNDHRYVVKDTPLSRREVKQIFEKLDRFNLEKQMREIAQKERINLLDSKGGDNKMLGFACRMMPSFREIFVKDILPMVQKNSFDGIKLQEAFVKLGNLQRDVMLNVQVEDGDDSDTRATPFKLCLFKTIQEYQELMTWARVFATKKEGDSTVFENWTGDFMAKVMDIDDTPEVQNMEEEERNRFLIGYGMGLNGAQYFVKAIVEPSIPAK